MTSLETDALRDLICAKRECLLELRDMVRRQLELIDKEEMTALLDLLAAKQRVLTRLQRIEAALHPFRNQDPEQRRWRSREDRRRCAEQLQQCETLLAEIINQEKCGEGLLIRRRDAAASRLRQAHFVSRARETYTCQPPGQTNQLDLHSDG